MAGELGADYFEGTQRKWGKNKHQKDWPCRSHEYGGRPVPQSDPTCDDEVIERAVGSFETSECFSDEVEPPTSDEPVVLSTRERKKMKRARARAREEAEARKAEPGSAKDIVSDNEVHRSLVEDQQPGLRLTRGDQARVL